MNSAVMPVCTRGKEIGGTLSDSNLQQFKILRLVLMVVGGRDKIVTESSLACLNRVATKLSTATDR